MKTSVLDRYPRFVGATRPSLEEVDRYGRAILQHEGRPLAALPDCLQEAELQLWAMRSLPAGRQARRTPATGVARADGGV
jgi:hypothetical protein